jgi:hypothetical protein
VALFTCATFSRLVRFALHVALPIAKWSNDQLRALHRVPGSAFEVVEPAALGR